MCLPGVIVFPENDLSVAWNRPRLPLAGQILSTVTCYAWSVWRIAVTDWIERRVKGMSPEALSDAIFAGRILYFEGLQPMQDLIACARRCIDATFPGHDPVSAHTQLDQKSYEERCAAMRKAFITDRKALRALEASLTAAGVDGHATYRDRLVLRVSPPGALGYRRGFGTVPPHRDSWGSGLMNQINWWLPVYPITKERTLAIFPAHWKDPVKNDSRGWNWREAGKNPGVALLPTAQSDLDRSGEIRVVVEPGTLVAFSAAHLHASVKNTTNAARFSCESRTVNIDELRSGNGAPDIDGGGVQPALEWFVRLGDGEALTPRADLPDTLSRP